MRCVYSPFATEVANNFVFVLVWCTQCVHVHNSTLLDTTKLGHTNEPKTTMTKSLEQSGPHTISLRVITLSNVFHQHSHFVFLSQERSTLPTTVFSLYFRALEPHCTRIDWLERDGRSLKNNFTPSSINNTISHAKSQTYRTCP